MSLSSLNRSDSVLILAYQFNSADVCLSACGRELERQIISDFDTGDLFGDSSQHAAGFIGDVKILDDDPFQTLDQGGIGQLVEMGVKGGRSTRPKLKIGICGEHGGDPASVKFCHRIGLDYVSCSPFRVPIARFAAAQAAIETPRKKAAAKKKAAKKKVTKKKVVKKAALKKKAKAKKRAKK